MNYFKRRKILKSISASDLVPVRVHGHEMADGKVVILAPKFEGRWVHNLFPRTQKLFYHIRLDELGSHTWLSISGELTVAGVTAEVIKQLGDKSQTIEEADSRVEKFISLLYDWKYITFTQIM